jgi:hypothetical protein
MRLTDPGETPDKSRSITWALLSLSNPFSPLILLSVYDLINGRPAVRVEELTALIITGNLTRHPL